MSCFYIQQEMRIGEKTNSFRTKSVTVSACAGAQGRQSIDPSFGKVLQRLEILDDLQALFLGKLAVDHLVAFRAVIEFMPSIGIAG
jgi:hypothetical protein